MPLSEDEQRILHEIERRFYEHDPEYAKTIESTTLYRSLGRNCKWAALGFLAGLIILMVSFASNEVLGVFGFVVMLASAIILIHNLRLMGRHGMRQLAESVRARHVNESVDDALRRLRRRFGRDDTP